MSILDYIEKIKRENEGPRIMDQESRNMKLAKANDIPDAFNPDLEQSEFLRPGETLETWEPNPFLKPHADGGRAGYNAGQLVTPSVDGSRPGYAGVYKRKDQRNAWRVMGERGGINVAKWLKSQGLESTYTNKKAADAAYKKFLDANPDKLSDVTKAKWMKEGEELTTKFNTLVQKAFDAGDMSKTPRWETFLKKQKLKHAGVSLYQAQRVNLGAVDVSLMKRKLADKLINEASKDLKYKPWMDIQRKLSSSADINTNIWREYIDKHNKINGQSAKVKQAFDYLKNNDVALKIPKNLSKTMAMEGSLLRKVIHGLTGVNTRGIREGLAGLDEATKSQIAFADKGTLWTEGQGRTLKEILDDAAYRMDGNISWSSDIKKLSGRPNKNAFQYALTNFNYYGKRGEVGQIQFYYKRDTGMTQPIKWGEIEWDNKGGKKLKPSKVFFVDSTDPTGTQWTTEKIDSDHKNWRNNKKTVGLLDELYQAKDVYDNLLNTEVTDPRNPKGAKVKFGKIMKDVYGEGYDNFGNPYAIEHGDTVAKSPWKNLRISEQRINSALYNITRKKGISESVRKQIINQLSKQTYNVFDKDVITKIIEGQKPVIQSVLGEGKKYNKSVLNEILAGWCSKGTQRVKDGGRIGFSGDCPDGEKITNMKNAAEKLKQHDRYLRGLSDTTPFADNAEAKALASKMAKSGGLLMRAGRIAMGPMTLWGEPLFEAAFVAHDILGTGTPWKEGVAKSLWAKPAIAMGLLKPADQQYEEALWQVRDEEGKALLKEDQTMAAPGVPMELRTRTGVKRFIDNNKKLDELNRLFALKQSAHISAPGRTSLSANEIAQNKAARDKNYKDYLESLGGAEGVRNIKAQIENDREAYDDRVAALEIERAQDSLSGGVISGQKADQLQREKMKDLMYQKYGKKKMARKGGEWIIDPELKGAFFPQEVLDPNFNMRTILDLPTEASWSPNYPKTYADFYPTPSSRYGWDQTGPIAQAGGISKLADGGRAGYMGGGIAGIRRPHAIPPKRQGLRSIMINGKKS